MADVLAAARDAIADQTATDREKLLAQGVLAMMEDTGKLIALVEIDRDRLLTITRRVINERIEDIRHARETSMMCQLERFVRDYDEAKKRRGQ
jgi:hypothetical protein